ncbi:MAG: DEAD/DEAH box helicase [Microbacterium sp.]|uniref:DEAD/DEAH box helicase n=1 Tax=Microbacterium sp. TaxID=51671 RepID=UPI0039E46C3F
MPAPYLAPAEIRRQAWGAGYERGVAYFRAGRVVRLEWDEPAATLRSVVRGSGAKSYRCAIAFRVASGRPSIRSATCTCPMEVDCKHTVATMLAGNAEFADGAPTEPAARAAALPAPVGAPKRPEPASWRELLADSTPTAATPLALGLELRMRAPFHESRWDARRPQTATTRSVLRGGVELLLGARPLMRSPTTGKWIQGHASWDAVRRPGQAFPPAQSRWFAELHAIARDPQVHYTPGDSAEWITLDSVESALFWEHLRDAQRRGIPIVPTKKNQSFALAAAADVGVAVTADPDGALRLRPHAELEGAEVDASVLRPLGGVGVYSVAVDRDQLAVTMAPAPLDHTTRRLLSTPDGFVVPAGDADEFLRVGYPRLARRARVTTDGGLDLPAAQPPRLVATVRFRPADTLEYTLEWDYPGEPRFAYPAQESIDRDSAFESARRAEVEAAWADAASVPFAPAATLHDVDAAEFCDRVLPALEGLDGVRVDTRGTRRAYRELTGDPEITVTTVESTDPDWFDFGVIVKIDGRSIPFTPLFTALAQRKRKILLADGRYFSLAHPALDRLRELIDEAADLAEWETGPRISRYQTALWADFEDLADVSEPAVSWRATAEGLRDAERLDPTPVPAGLRAELRPYQRAGFDWLAFLWRHRLGGILADDMGLGKTLQALALIAHAAEPGPSRPWLVVAPTSVLSTWESEAARFAPGLRVRVVDATGARRGETVQDAAASADIVVTSYTLLRLDEAEFAKNPQTKVHRAAKALRADVVFAITGTPLENSLSELWALLSLTAPGLFASARRFREEYIKPIEQGKVPENTEGGPFRAARLERLRRRIRPLVLRRTKELVAPDLPPKQEQELRIELSPAHRAVYDLVLQRERQQVLGLLEDLDRNRFIVFRSLTLLRLLSLAPGLVDPEHAHIASSKLDVLLDQLSEVVAEGHRALVFSQFTSFLDLAQQRLDAAGIPHVRLDGTTRRRAAVVEQFRAGGAPVFLISLKAGGFGLTLTEADYVFLLDPWWNPAAEAQAVDRTHRIGQTRSVMVYRMIAAGTIEEKVMALQRRKARLFRSVMDDDALFAQALTADDIRRLFDD